MGDSGRILVPVFVSLWFVLVSLREMNELFARLQQHGLFPTSNVCLGYQALIHSGMKKQGPAARVCTGGVDYRILLVRGK